MRLFRSCAFVAASLLLGSIAAAQSTPVSIQFQDGNVTLRTSGRLPLRTVLQEWARVGRTKIVNVESVPGTLEQIELVNVPEQKALAVLLRDISGYVVGAREPSAAGVSSVVPNSAARFDRIMLLPKIATPQTNTVTRGNVTNTAPPPPIAFVAGDPDDPNDVPPTARALTPQQLQNNANVAAARDAAARAAAQGQPNNSDRNPSEDVQRPATPPANTPTNPFFNGRSGRPGEVNPVPQQQRNPLRPNGDPEP